MQQLFVLLTNARLKISSFIIIPIRRRIQKAPFIDQPSQNMSPAAKEQIASRQRLSDIMKGHAEDALKKLDDDPSGEYEDLFFDSVFLALKLADILSLI